MREVVIAIAMGAAWVFLYMLIGGRWPKPFRSGPLTSGMQWRAAIATLLFIALLAAGAIAGSGRSRRRRSNNAYLPAHL